MSTLTFVTTLATITCPECAGHYAISQEFMDEARRVGNFKQCWTCPYCKTSRGYGTGEVDKLNAQIAEQQRQLTAVKCDLLSERTLKDKAERACRRITKRIQAGVCPCCNRTVSQLARHMATKHPEFVPSHQIAR